MNATSELKAISEPKDYYSQDREIVHFAVSVKQGDVLEEVRKVSNVYRSNVIPAKDCVVVLDGNSIPLSSLYELSGVHKPVDLFKNGKLNVFGYCEAANVQGAIKDSRAILLTALTKSKAELQEQLRATEASIEALK